MTVALHVNGRLHALGVPADAPLLQVLRNDLALNGPKYGCGLGECGACLVLIDGVPARSCCVPVGVAAGRAIVTLEGLGALAAARDDAGASAGDAAGDAADEQGSATGDAAGAALRGAAGVEARALHPVQQAFIDEQAAQCGYCLNGMIVATVALLRRHPQPTDRQVRDALSHNLCRCGTHLEILRAVRRAAQLMAAAVAAESAVPASTPAGG